MEKVFHLFDFLKLNDWGFLAFHFRERCLGLLWSIFIVKWYSHASLSYRFKFKSRGQLGTVCGDGIQNTNGLYGLGMAPAMSAGLHQLSWPQGTLLLLLLIRIVLSWAEYYNFHHYYLMLLLNIKVLYQKKLLLHVSLLPLVKSYFWVKGYTKLR